MTVASAPAPASPADGPLTSSPRRSPTTWCDDSPRCCAIVAGTARRNSAPVMRVGQSVVTASSTC
jgi:hypothetical protein